MNGSNMVQIGKKNSYINVHDLKFVDSIKKTFSQVDVHGS
jgi:hypothetical protein